MRAEWFIFLSLWKKVPCCWVTEINYSVVTLLLILDPFETVFYWVLHRISWTLYFKSYIWNGENLFYVCLLEKEKLWSDCSGSYLSKELPFYCLCLIEAGDIWYNHVPASIIVSKLPQEISWLFSFLFHKKSICRNSLSVIDLIVYISDMP